MSTDKRKDNWRMEKPLLGSSTGGPSNAGVYQPPTLHELQSQNRQKARKFYPKKKFNDRFKPFAPRNTTSFIIRAKKSGGIASLVSPCPVTPAVLPTPVFSPSREVLGDMAKEEWGVDGYGSMKGLIRLRNEEVHDDEEEEEGGDDGSSESDVEEHVEVERRLDHDLSRFEMIYPNYGIDYNNVLENRVDDQDSHIAQLEEENLTLKERLFLMETELGDLRRRLQFLERQNQVVEDVNEEVVENGSENESEGGSDALEMGGESNMMAEEYLSEDVGRGDVDNYPKGDETENEGVKYISTEELMQDRLVNDENKIEDEKVPNEFVPYGETVKKDIIKEEVRAGYVPDQVVEKEKEVGDGDMANEFLTDEGIAEETNVKDEEKQNENEFVADEGVAEEANAKNKGKHNESLPVELTSKENKVIMKKLGKD